MESGSRIGDLFLNVEKEVMNGATETNLVDERLKQTNQNSNLNEVVNWDAIVEWLSLPLEGSCVHDDKSSTVLLYS